MNTKNASKTIVDSTAEPANQFGIQKLYIKQASFTSFGTPDLFEKPWKPETKFEIKTHFKPTKEHHHEVTLEVAVTLTQDADTIAMIEVKQSGVFLVKGYEGEQLDQLLKSYCPNVLFPYVRETISRLSADGGLPSVYLVPINFDAIYVEQQKQLKEKSEKNQEPMTIH